MLRDNENLKDTASGANVSSSNRLPVSPYNKTQKLITALFMVTDILEKDEPMRKKLRDLGTNIISEIGSSASMTAKHTSEIVSLLDIASAVKMISPMNAGILKKEFIELKTSLGFSGEGDSAWLEGFLSAPASASNFSRNEISVTEGESRNYAVSAPRPLSTRIGVQKGSTLLQALSDKMPALSKKTPAPSEDLHVLKQERREAIIKIIKENKVPGSEGGMTISDIRNASKNEGAGGIVSSMSEKTLQRELLSMLKDNVLNKTGEKRWSRYFLAK